MSRSNYDKPFYIDVGTSIVAVRCASNHDVVLRYDHSWHPSVIELAEAACDRMNKEAEIGKPRRNCDVGTAEEQTLRFREFCGSRCMAKCKVYEKGMALGIVNKNNYYKADCRFVWEQMPYEAEEGEGAE